MTAPVVTDLKQLSDAQLCQEIDKIESAYRDTLMVEKNRKKAAKIMALMGVLLDEEFRRKGIEL